MQQETTKDFKYDEQEQVYNLHIEQKSPIKIGNVTVATTASVTDQKWTKDGVKELQKALARQLIDANKAIEQTEEQIKAQGKFTDREIQNLVKFKESLEKVTKLAQKEKLEDQLKTQEGIRESLTKDIKEVNDAVVPEEVNVKPE